METVNDVISALRRQDELSGVWAWENFLPSVERLIIASGAKDVIEIGGGRSPSFSQEQINELKLNYVSNDISDTELARAPNWVGLV